MENKTKGIIGAVGALAIGAGAYFGFNWDGKEADDFPIYKLKIDTFVEEYAPKYNVKFIEDTDDGKFLDSTLSRDLTDIVGLNTEFHIWSWHKYLHLTQKVDTSNKLLDIPHFLASEKMMQVDGYGQKVEFDRSGSKILSLVLDQQAGSDHPKLYSKPNHAGQSFKTYYSMHLDTSMYNLMVEKSCSKSEIYKQLIGKEEKGSTLITEDNDQYPIGSIELKASWIDVNAFDASLEEVRRKYITVKAIDNVHNSNNNNNNNEVIEVAMVGLHLVGRVKGFEELLWATFEGTDLAPDDVDNLVDNNSKSKYGFIEGSHESVVRHNFLYFKEGEKGEKTNDAAAIQYKNVQHTESDEFNKDSKYAFKVFRRYPLGFDIDTDAENSHLSITNYINERMLAKKVTEYYYNGSIWLERLNNKIIGIDKVEGSPMANNVTMESFHQDKHCFKCHIDKTRINDSEDPRLKIDALPYTIKDSSMLGVSHIYQAILVGKISEKVLNKPGIEDKNSCEEIKFSSKVKELIEKVKNQNEIILGN